MLLVIRDFPMDDVGLFDAMKALLPRYHVPRHILRVAAVPVAGNGKIDRKACRELALEAGAIR